MLPAQAQFVQVGSGVEGEETLVLMEMTLKKLPMEERSTTEPFSIASTS